MAWIKVYGEDLGECSWKGNQSHMVGELQRPRTLISTFSKTNLNAAVGIAKYSLERGELELSLREGQVVSFQGAQLTDTGMLSVMVLLPRKGEDGCHHRCDAGWAS